MFIEVGCVEKTERFLPSNTCVILIKISGYVMRLVTELSSNIYLNS